MSLGDNIRERRKALGLTQEALSEALHMAPQTVSKWERNESMPDAALLPLLADTLGCSLDRLFDRKCTEFSDAANAAKDWLTMLHGRERWDGALRLGRIMQTALAGFWDDPSFPFSSESYDDERSISGICTSDEGFSVSTRAKDFPYLYIFPEPEKGWAPFLEQENPEFWELLSNAAVRRAVCRIFSGEFPECFDTEWAIKKSGLDEPLETLSALSRLGVLYSKKVAIDGDDETLWYLLFPLRLLAILLLGSVKPGENPLGFSAYRRRAQWLRKMGAAQNNEEA